MPIPRDTLRQVDLSGGVYPVGPTPSASSDHLKVSEVQTSSVDIKLSNKSEYPFPEQEITEGEFEYEARDFTGVAKATGSFQVRPASELFVVRKQGSAEFDDIIEAISDFLEESYDIDATVHTDFRASGDRLWDFVNNARWAHDIDVYYKGNERVSITEMTEKYGHQLADIQGSYPISHAKLVLETPWGEPVSVVYDIGRLEIKTSDSDVHEFVLQTFERDVMNR